VLSGAGADRAGAHDHVQGHDSSSDERALLSFQSKSLSVHRSLSRALLSVLWHTGSDGACKESFQAQK